MTWSISRWAASCASAMESLLCFFCPCGSYSLCLVFFNLGQPIHQSIMCCTFVFFHVVDKVRNIPRTRAHDFSNSSVQLIFWPVFCLRAFSQLGCPGFCFFFAS